MKESLWDRRERVWGEVERINLAWPAAEVIGSRYGATVVIEEPRSTYIIRVLPDSVHSLHIAYGEDGQGVTDGWRQGWVD